MKFLSFLSLLLILSLSSVDRSVGATLLGWDFNAASPSGLTQASTSNDPSVTASTITIGAGLINGDNGPDQWGFVRDNQSSFSDALANDDYFEFTITPTGAGVIVEQLNLQVSLRETGNPHSFGLYSSADNYTNLIDSGQTGTGSGTFSVSLDMGDSQLTNATTFRLAAINQTGANTNAAAFGPIAGNAIEVVGAVVPEPHGAALMGIGLLLICCRRGRGLNHA